MSSQSRLSTQLRIPPELIAEIVAYNADDIPALHAMSLVSKAMRSFTIEHLFAAIHFICEQDITWWGAMVQRTPRLQHIVKRVKFSDPSADEIRRHRHVRYLSEAVVPPKIPIMPNVSIVEWESDTHTMDNSMAIAYMSLFPNSTELRLSGMHFHLAGKFGSGFDQLARFLCGRKLRVLSFCSTHVWDEPNEEDLTFDLTSLEELRVVGCSPDFFDNTEFVSQLVEASRPAALKSLTFAWRFGLGASIAPCSLQTMENILLIANPCLVNLSLIWDLYVWGE
ncbi:hypothetical protein DFH08DRAFT_949949 [Mycena albidolilacea]|uniref:F-box domain-containing protein n=1 Tax=Mycena albidolilacea TaxID=1033008 RepID=A0AAD7AP10_9AGAR|nr:hypothetical protein DFH08DRAFT_949949 [Mycena albidolilacea]